MLKALHYLNVNTGAVCRRITKVWQQSRVKQQKADWKKGFCLFFSWEIASYFSKRTRMCCTRFLLTPKSEYPSRDADRRWITA